MSLDAVPPRKRKAILVLSEVEKTQLELSKDPKDRELLLNEQIYILVPKDEPIGSLESKLENSNLLDLGNLLIQNPYDTSNYKLVDKAYSSFSLAKYYHFTTLCGHLGATEVIIEQIQIETSNKKTLFKGTFEKFKSGGTLAVDNEAIAEISQYLQLKHEFHGGQPNINEAEAHLDRYRLRGDDSMTSLIDQRRFGSLKSREVVLALSDDVKSNLGVVADAKIPTVANLNATLDRVKQESYSFTVKINVKF